MSNDRNMAAGEAVVQPIAVGLEYASAVIALETTRALFDLALQCGNAVLANELAQQLLAAIDAVHEAHIRMLERFQETMNRIPASAVNLRTE